MNTAERDSLVLDNLPLVGFLVSDLCARANHLSREDLASVGTLGLMTAAENFDSTRGVPFGAYARRRILGALYDELRSQDIFSRTERKRVAEAKGVQESLTEALGRKPTVAEVAEALGVPVQSAREVLGSAERAVVPLDAVIESGDVWLDLEDRPSPEEEILAREQSHMVRQAVDLLPERLRMVVEEIYFKGRSVGDVAEDVGLTYSSISHARIEAVRLLRDGLRAHYSDSEHAPELDDADGPTRGPKGRRKEYLQALGERSRGGLVRSGAEAELATLAKAS